MNATQKTIQKKIDKLMSKFESKYKDSTLEEYLKNDDETRKEYNKLKRQFNQVWKDELVALCDEAKDDLVDYGAFVNHLNSEKIDHCLPTGFTGWIDRDRKWYDDEGQPIEGVPSGFMFPTVKMNPKFDPENSPWVFVAVREDGTNGNYFYRTEFKKSQRTKKFLNVRKLLDEIDEIRDGWVQLLQHPFRVEENPKNVAAVILELLYKFSARVGSEGNGTSHKKVEKTYGISTLRRKHVRFTPQAVIISYKGKDGVKTKHVLGRETITERQLRTALHHLCKDKMPSDPLFTYRLRSSGSRKPVRAGVVNKLFAELGGEACDCTVHKLRTYQATVLAEELINDFYKMRKRFYKAKDAVEALTKLAEKVGKKLNHVRRDKEGRQKVTGKTALQNYIDVALQRQFFDHYEIPLPLYLEKLVG